MIGWTYLILVRYEPMIKLRIVTHGIIDGEYIDSNKNDNIGADTW